LPGFKAVAGWKGTTRFYRDGTPGVTAFADMGRKIRVYQSDDETILAALQLARQKWGGVQVNGTDEYKRRCAEIAAEHGIRITNPELCDIKSQERHDTAERAKAQATAMADKTAIIAPIRETATNAKTPDAPAAQNAANSPDSPMEAAYRPRRETRPMRLAERRKADAGTIDALRSRRKEIEATLDAKGKAIAEAAIENLKKTADEKRKRLEAEKASAASAVRDIEEREPVKGLFGFGYGAKKAEWDKLLRKAKSDDAWVGRALEEHDKALRAAVFEAAETSKEAAKSRNAEAVKELEAIDVEIGRLNSDINGIYRAAKSLLHKSEYHRFPNVRLSEQGGAYRGEILGVAEYNGYVVVLQDGPTEHFETGRKNMYGDPETVRFHIVLAHEISPEEVPEMKALTGNVATITVDEAGSIGLTDVCTTRQEQERSRGHGFSR
jgi:hypothetical protein